MLACESGMRNAGLCKLNADNCDRPLYINLRPAPSGLLAFGGEVTTRSSEGLDERRRRLLFRSWHSGIREMDLIMGRFADARLAGLNAAELDDYERLLTLPTPQLLAWVMGEEAPTPDYDGPLFRQLQTFHLGPRTIP
jgi:antitoxin CptB